MRKTLNTCLTKHQRRHLLGAVIALLLLPLIGGCRPNSGDGVMERPNYTMVNYELEFTEHFLQFYDVTVTYMTVDGKKLTEVVTLLNWNYKEKSEEQYSNFYLSAYAKAKPKEQRPTLGKEVTELDFSCDYSAEYYSKATSAKRIHNKGAYAVVKKESVDTYLADHSEVKICEIDFDSFKE